MKQRDSLQWECWDGRQTGCPPGRLQAVSAGPQSPHRAEKQETGVPDQGFPAKPEPLEESSSLGGRSRAASTHTGAATRSCFQAQAGVGGRSRAASAHTGAATRSCFQAQAGPLTANSKTDAVGTGDLGALWPVLRCTGQRTHLGLFSAHIGPEAPGLCSQALPVQRHSPGSLYHPIWIGHS